MTAKTKSKIVSNGVTIKKGETGQVVAFQSNPQGFYYLVNFPSAKYVQCPIEQLETKD